MMTLWLIGIAYSTCLLLLAGWGIHRFVLLAWLRRTRSFDIHDCRDTPTVLVQIPVFNEPQVVSRVIDAVAALDWPALEIQVLDDSTDTTSTLAAHRIAFWADQGLVISHIRRAKRTGYKAGALAHGLRQSTAQYIAVFDADFVPQADFLRKMMPSLLHREVGMVQACWGHLNRDQNWLTRIQALILDGHFVVEHTARFRAGRFFNFNGTAGIWKRRCIESSGGWQHDTVTEDLDLSYRAQMKGWQFVYRHDVIAPAEVPATAPAFLRQQRRWAKGTVQTSRKLLEPILRSRLPFRVRMEAANHLMMVWAYPVVFALSLLLPTSIYARASLVGLNWLFFDLIAIVATTISLGIFYAVTMRLAHQRIGQRWWEIPLAMAVGIGCSLSQTLAVFEGAFSNDATFDRTPKQGAEKRMATRVPMQLVPALGGTLMSAYYAFALYICATSGHWHSLPFITLCALGYWLITGAQWKEGLRTGEAVEMDVAHAAK